MVTTLAQIGDFHARPDARNADRYRVISTILEAIKALAALSTYGATFWPGDLNHGKMTIFDKNQLRAIVQQLAKFGPVFICRGNHDEPGDLDFLAFIKAPYPIFVINEPRCVRAQLATGQWMTVFAMPYPDKGRLVDAKVSPVDIVNVATELIDPIFMTACAELEAARAQGDLTAMIGHFNVRGSKTSKVGQPLIGQEIELSAQHLDRLGPIFKGLNHIHMGQEIAGAWYAGSTYRQDYGEIDPKRFLLIDFEADSSYIVHPQPLDIPPMFHIEGELTRDGFFPFQSAPLCQSCDGSGNEAFPMAGDEDIDPLYCYSCGGDGRRKNWTGCDCRVRCFYKASEKAVLDESIIREMYGSALRLKIEKVAIPDRDVRAPEVAAATTLAGKVAAYQKVEQLDPAIADKLAALEHKDPAQLLADVDAFLAGLEREADPAVAA